MKLDLTGVFKCKHLNMDQKVPVISDLFHVPAQCSNEGQDESTETTCSSNSNHMREEDRKDSQTQQQECPPQHQVLLPAHRTS